VKPVDKDVQRNRLSGHNTGFILNILFVDHSNTSSYTLYFSLSLLGFSPFILLWNWWCWWRGSGMAQERERNVALGILGAGSASGDLEARLGRELQVDRLDDDDGDDDKELLKDTENEIRGNFGDVWISNITQSLEKPQCANTNIFISERTPFQSWYVTYH
jgi:hypothetical protein